TFSFSFVSLIKQWLAKGIGVSHAKYAKLPPQPRADKTGNVRTTYTSQATLVLVLEDVCLRFGNINARYGIGKHLTF
ncbi:MAG: hypothetical protein ACON4U_20755, partial [Myxococcota bacterium]